jgi:hypothetical protein
MSVFKSTNKDITLNDYINRLTNNQNNNFAMTELIKELIRKAGFSSTYEHERLTKLCKLVANYCVDESKQMTHDQLVEKITRDFDL